MNNKKELIESLKGKMIVIEGTDGVGKSTQVNKLIERLELDDSQLRFIHYPCYGNISASFVEPYLRGELGTHQEIPNKEKQLYFIMDRLVHQRTSKMREFLDNGGIVICDRYLYSNNIHQFDDFDIDAIERHVNIAEPVDSDYLLSTIINDDIRRINQFELGLGVIEPDIKIGLGVHPSITEKNLDGRDEERDVIEQLDFDEKLKSYYMTRILESAEGFEYVECGSNGKMKSIDEISDIIFDILESRCLNNNE